MRCDRNGHHSHWIALVVGVHVFPVAWLLEIHYLLRRALVTLDCGADDYAGLDSWCGASASCSWMRELISSLANTFRRCHSTVRGLR